MANHKKKAGWRRPVKEENVQIGERCRKASGRIHPGETG